MNTSLAGLSISSFELNMPFHYTKCLFFPLVIPVLKQVLWQAGQQKFLLGWWNEATTSVSARKRAKSEKS